jgi:nitroimidazol reductase NimA-like FMN-containing flavoprotein (pyridoxamine 5'-phosphate oxidase superfamily)
MFQEMRRRDRQLSRRKAEATLGKGLFGVLSLNGGDYPYGVPMSYVYLDNRIYLHCALEGKKLDLLRANNRVAFCVVAEAEPKPEKFSMKYQSAMVFGKIYQITDAEEKLQSLIALVEKYYRGDQAHIKRGKETAAASLEITAVLRIDIEHLTGKIRK